MVDTRSSVSRSDDMLSRVEGLEKAVAELTAHVRSLDMSLDERILRCLEPVLRELRGPRIGETIPETHPDMSRDPVSDPDASSPIPTSGTPPAMILRRRFPSLSWDQFSRELLLRFGDDSACDSYEALAATKQDGSVADYIASFESHLAQLPNLTDNQFLVKMAKRIERMSTPLTCPIKNDSGNFSTQRSSIQRSSHPQAHPRPPQHPATYSPNSTAVPNSGTPNSTFSHSDSASSFPLSSGQHPNHRFRNMSQEEYNKHRAAGTCFQCGLKYSPTHRCPPKTLQLCKSLSSLRRYSSALGIVKISLKLDALPVQIKKEVRTIGAQLEALIADPAHGWDLVSDFVSRDPYSFSAWNHCYKVILRNRLDKLEALYNIARSYHHVGLVSLAAQYYEKALTAREMDYPVPTLPYENQNATKIKMPGYYDLCLEAAYNLHLIYKQSGAFDLARQLRGRRRALDFPGASMFFLRTLLLLGRAERDRAVSMGSFSIVLAPDEHLSQLRRVKLLRIRFALDLGGDVPETTV
ncbi:hypothetical protein SASPL_137975 [Salvia splendens]|uniref:Retrotransposon gag domain-containing protein n=1 Tax=Salvia splendens TaxID=180675 RepID=A0A8X8WSP2_SALSN|nr:hypothetical protein SASPL_137975 [Salvia splendens]